jgi:hypothetical protein
VAGDKPHVVVGCFVVEVRLEAAFGLAKEDHSVAN